MGKSDETPSQFDNTAVEKLAESIKPVRPPRRKKGKSFADKDFMLGVLEKANEALEERHNAFFAKESEIIKAIARRDRMRESRKQAKADKVSKMKARLTETKRKVVGGKGDHRKFEDTKEQAPRGKAPASKPRPKRPSRG